MLQMIGCPAISPAISNSSSSLPHRQLKKVEIVNIRGLAIAD